MGEVVADLLAFDEEDRFLVYNFVQVVGYLGYAFPVPDLLSVGVIPNPPKVFTGILDY